MGTDYLPLILALTAAGVVAALAAIAYWRAEYRRAVFISYRRADASSEAAHIASQLRRRFGRRVFLDVHSLHPGDIFRSAIARTLRTCDAAVILIGPDWLSAADEHGTRRLDEPDDLVRIEVESAMESGALVIPVLLRGTGPPTVDHLPPSIATLESLNMFRFDGSIAPVAAAISAAPVRRSARILLLAHAALPVLLSVFYATADALTPGEFESALGIVLPMFAASAAVALVQALPSARPPTRVPFIAKSVLFIPLAFVATMAGLFVLKTLNVGIHSYETFGALLIAVETGFSAYTGVFLTSLLENRRQL